MGMPSPGGTTAPGVKISGKVKTWNDEKGFGFIIPEDGGADVFVHRSTLTDGNLLQVGAAVLYELTWSAPKNKYAAVGVMGAMNSPSSLPGGGAPGGGGGMPVGSLPGSMDSGGSAPPSDNLFVAGLPLDITDDKLKIIMGGYGTVVDGRVLPDSGKADRAALVRMGDAAMATFLVNNVHGTVPAGHGLTMPLTIRFAQNNNNKGKGKGAPDARASPYEAPLAPGPVGGLPSGGFTVPAGLAMFP